MFTFDTNALVYYLAGKGELVSFVEEYKDSVFFLPTVVAVEFLSYPLLDSRTLRLFEEFMKDLIVVNLDLELAKFAGNIRRRYDLKTIDAIVAVSALSTSSKLLTYNVKDFARVRELEILAP